MPDMNEEELLQTIYEKNAKIKILEEQNKKAREMILKLYNAGRNVLMCYKLPRFEKEAYNRLSDCINNREVEKVLKELE